MKKVRILKKHILVIFDKSKNIGDLERKNLIRIGVTKISPTFPPQFPRHYHVYLI